MPDFIKLPPPYREFVDRLLKLFNLKNLHRVTGLRRLDFDWFTAYVSQDEPSETYIMWCKDASGDCFFKMADYSLLNVWDEQCERAVQTLRDSETKWCSMTSRHPDLIKEIHSRAEWLFRSLGNHTEAVVGEWRIEYHRENLYIYRICNQDGLRRLEYSSRWGRSGGTRPVVAELLRMRSSFRRAMILEDLADA